ncbi:MAG TPA: glycine zipper family protein, partial [Herbaspirillum sp.]|nr:glycine zipper family protein [Herbaspirillum sp.]
MLSKYKLIPIAAAAVVLAGCATAPTGPQVMVMPGAGKSYEQFRQDEDICQNYAFQATGNAVR